MKKLILFFWNDLKTDYFFLRDLINKKKDSPYIKKFKSDDLKNFFSFTDVIKKNWILFLLLILAFSVGFFMASKIYQQKCNVFIMEEFIIPYRSHNVFDFNLNESNFNGVNFRNIKLRTNFTT